MKKLLTSIALFSICVSLNAVVKKWDAGGTNALDCVVGTNLFLTDGAANWNVPANWCPNGVPAVGDTIILDTNYISQVGNKIMSIAGDLGADMIVSSNYVNANGSGLGRITVINVDPAADHFITLSGAGGSLIRVGQNTSSALAFPAKTSTGTPKDYSFVFGSSGIIDVALNGQLGIEVPIYEPGFPAFPAGVGIVKTGPGALLMYVASAPCLTFTTGKNIIGGAGIALAGTSGISMAAEVSLGWVGTNPPFPIPDQTTFTNFGTLDLVAFPGAGITIQANHGFTMGAGGGVLQPASTEFITLSNSITGPGKLVKTGGGTLTLAGANNDFAGGFLITKGIVNFDGGAAGASAGTGLITVAPQSANSSPIVLGMRAVGLGAALTATVTNDILFVPSTTGIFSSVLNSVDLATPNNAGVSLTLSGKLTGAQPLLRGSAAGSGGEVVLSGDNSGWTGGMTWIRGTNTLGHQYALGTGSLKITPTTSGPTNVVLTANTALTGGSAVTNPITLNIAGGARQLEIGGANALELSGPITLSTAAAITNENSAATTLSGPISGTLALTLQNAGSTFTLSANSPVSGATTIAGGTVTLGSGAILPNSTVSIAAGSIDLPSGSAAVGALGGAGTVTLGTSTLTNGGNNASTTYSGVISDTAGGGLTKNGTGTLTLSGANTYSGLTLVNAGTLKLANTTATGTGAVQVQPGASLSGVGTVNGTLTVSGTIDPGSSPGTITASGGATWNAGGKYIWHVEDSGVDLVAVTGGLTISGATPENPFTVSMGSVNFSTASFDNTSDTNWTIVTTTTGITGFDPNNVALDTTGFTNALVAGRSFRLALNGNNLEIQYVATVDPIVTTQPVSQSANYSSNVTFTVVGYTASTPLTYQWQKNGVDVAGATDSALTLTAVTYSDASIYRCKLTNNIGGDVNSLYATLTVTDPIITTQPTNTAVTVGSVAHLIVGAIGSPTVSYQWKKNGSNVSDGGDFAGATTSDLAITAQSADAGNYTVVVSGSASLQSITSATAALTVNALPIVTNPPMRRVVQQGSSSVGVGFAVGAQNATGFTWKTNGVTAAYFGSTNSTFVYTNPPVGVSTVSVDITNAFGTTTTNCTLTVQTGNIRLWETNLCVLRLGEGLYQGSSLGNAQFIDQFTTNGVYLNTVTLSDSGAKQTVMDTSSAGSFLSRSIDKRFLAFAGYNTNTWANRGVAGGGVNVTTSAGTVVPRQINTVSGLGFHAVPFKSTSYASATNFRGVATDGTNNFWGTTPNNGVTYITPPSTVQNLQVPVEKGNLRAAQIFNGDLWFTTGSGSFDSQQGAYQYSGRPTTGTPFPTPAQIYTDGTHQLINAVADVAVDPTGLIAYVCDDRPVSGDGFIGGMQRWEKIAGVWTFMYQMKTGLRDNGANFTCRHVEVDWSGANPVIYTTTSSALAEGSDQPRYFYKISDTGPASPFVLLMQSQVNFMWMGVKFGLISDPPTIAAQTGNLTNCVATTANFNVVAAGTAPFYYQWKSNGVDMVNGGNVAGATTANLTLSNVQLSDEKTYTCLVTNDLGTATSTPATLTVNDTTVTAPPTDILGVASGSSNVFHVIATAPHGTSETYQWSRSGTNIVDGGNISGATTANLTINPSTASDATTYTVVVAPGGCSTGHHTNSAELYVCLPITVSPSSLPIGFIGAGHSENTNTISATGGRGPYTFTVTLGTLPSGVTLTSAGLLSGVPAGASTNAITITATDTNGCTGSQAYSLQIIAYETTPPTVKFNTSPANNAFVTTSPTNITGTAKDSGVGASGIYKVFFSLNGGPTNNLATISGPPVSGTVNWTSSVPMIPGTNTVSMQAQDRANNLSLPTTSTVRKYFLSVAGIYTLVTNNNATTGNSVTGLPVAGDDPGVSGAALKIGRKYTVTAAAGPGNLFSNWLVSVNGGPTTVATNSLKYTFMMNSNVVLTANFITNKFTAAAGVYNGLFNDFSVAHQSAGWFTVKTDSKLKFTGKLLLQGEVVSFGGTFAQSGHGTLKPGKVVARKGLTNKPIVLTLDLNLASADSLTGYLTNAEGWDADMLGDKMTFNLIDNPATNAIGTNSAAGLFTFVYPGSLTAATEPGGDGYALAALTLDGKAKPTGGKAGDYQALKSTLTGISKNGYWPFYAPMYLDSEARPSPSLTAKTYRGSVFGWLQFTNSTLVGDLFWNKGGGWSNLTYYGSGFTNTQTILGSPYNKPLPGNRVLVTATALSVDGLELRDGNASPAITNSWFLTPNNAFFVTNSIPPKNPRGIKIAVSTAKGEITGSFTNNTGPAVKTTIKGVVLQNQQEIHGVFLGTSQSGSLRMTP